MPEVPVYFYNSNGRIITKDREIRRLIAEGRGKFKCNFTIRGRRFKKACINPETGEPATSSKEAQKIANRIYEAVISDTYEELMKNPLLSDFAQNTYLKPILQRKRAKKFYTTIVNAICRSKLGEMRIRKVTSDDIEEYLTQRGGEITRRKTPRAGSSLNRERFILSGIFKLAIRKKCYAGENPCRGIERFEETGRRTKTINADEEKRLLEAAYKLDPMLFHIIAIALKTGMRRAEVCCLRWEWLDFTRGKKGYINLPATICKNGKSRSIPMLYNVRELLLELMGDEEKTSGAVFRADAGPRRTRRRKIQTDHIDPQGIGQRVSRLCERIGLAKVGLHTLRHTFATRCLAAGIHPFIVKSWLGHATLTQTDYYSQVPFDVMENAAVKTWGENGQTEAEKAPSFPFKVPDVSADEPGDDVNS